MGKCNICEREIAEGQVTCQQCLQNKKSLNTGGFSLSGLAKAPPPKTPEPVSAPPSPQPSFQTAMPATPTLATPSTQQLPRQAPVPPQTPPIPAAPNTVASSPSSRPVFSPSPIPASTPTSTTTTPVPQPNTSASSSAPTRPQTPVPTQQTAQPSRQPAPPMSSIPPIGQAPSKQSILQKSNTSAAQQSQKLFAAKEAAENKTSQELQKKLFTSEMEGFGDEDLEISLLAGLLKDSFILKGLVSNGLIPGLFSTKYSRVIFAGIVGLRDENPDLSCIDKIVLKNKLSQRSLWNSQVQDFLEKILLAPAPDMDRALHYLTMMKEQALKRKLKEISHDINEYIDNPPEDESNNIEVFASSVIQNVRDIQRAKATKKISLVREEMKGILEDIDNREIVGEVDIIGYSFEPMHYLNKALSGFRKGFMYAIAGAPRRGKTTFTLELATRVATLNNIPVLFFTYEQTKKNLTYRLLAKESRLNPDSLQRKKIRSDMIMDAKFSGGWKQMQDYMDYFYIIEATKEDTIEKIRSYAYNVMQDFDTEDIMIFVDYLQKMPLSRTYSDSKFKVEEISTELKGLSIELNNPIMTISSLSKDGCMIDAAQDAERPTMYHCKGSGDLEYDLDCAMIQSKDWGDTRELFLQLQHKAEELGKDSTRVPKVDVVNLYLDKNRDAPEGIFSTIQYLFFIEDNKFIELGPKFDDDRYRFSKIEELVDNLIEQNYIIFHEKPKESTVNKGRVSIKLKNF